MQALLACTQQISCKFNLIPFNPHPGSPFQPSHLHDVLDFRHACHTHLLCDMQVGTVTLLLLQRLLALLASPSLVWAKLAAMCRSVLVQGGRVCTIRQSRGDDTLAACGQLGGVGDTQRRAPLLSVPAAFREAVAAAA